MRPLLIVVTGRPGAGKATLAQRLARAVRCPLISRDEIKEGLVHATGDTSERDASDTFFDTVKLLLGRRVTLVAEAAFQHKVWAPRLESLLEIARVRIVICDVTPELAQARHIERGRADPDRARFHPQPLSADYDPPKLDVPTLAVDTSDGYGPDFERIVEFARPAPPLARGVGMP